MRWKLYFPLNYRVILQPQTVRVSKTSVTKFDLFYVWRLLDDNYNTSIK
jgi:hypothetical protein